MTRTSVKRASILKAALHLFTLQTTRILIVTAPSRSLYFGIGIISRTCSSLAVRGICRKRFNSRVDEYETPGIAVQGKPWNSSGEVENVVKDEILGPCWTRAGRTMRLHLASILVSRWLHIKLPLLELQWAGSALGAFSSVGFARTLTHNSLFAFHSSFEASRSFVHVAASCSTTPVRLAFTSLFRRNDPEPSRVSVKKKKDFQFKHFTTLFSLSNTSLTKVFFTS